MKRQSVLPFVLAGLALILFAVVLGLSGGTVLYEASDDAYSPSHKDVSAVSVMTTEEAETISPLMMEIMKQSLKTALEIDAKDFEYSERELKDLENIVNRLKTNNGKIKLGNTEINDFRISSEELSIALEILNSDVARIEEIRQNIREGTLSSSDLSSLYAEIQQLSKEISMTADTYSETAETMIEVAQNQNLDTSSLEESINVVKKFAESSLSSVGSMRPGTSDLKILFTLSGDTFTYGDTLVIEGTSRLSGLHEIYLDTRVWSSVNLPEAGSFSKSFKITNVSKGSHTISILSQGHNSKQDTIRVITTNTTIFIDSAKVSGNSVEITGGLKTVHDVWVSGAKIDVYADGVGLLGTSTTNSNGVFSVQTELEDGEYQVYAEFSDISLPLEESVSEPITVKVSSSFLLPILGVAVLGVAAFIGVRIFRKRKISSIPEAVGFDVNVVRAVTPSPAKGIVKAIRKIISGHAKIEDSDKLRVIYRETISQIASYEKIRDIEVKTPREILSEISMQTSRISSFMTEYEYLHYADVTVSETDLEKMKNLAAEILESYHEENN
jgi:anti-sigma28 factor (negative regulator of flagellin synthesis)